MKLYVLNSAYDGFHSIYSSKEKAEKAKLELYTTNPYAPYDYIDEVELDREKAYYLKQ